MKSNNMINLEVTGSN